MTTQEFDQAQDYIRIRNWNPAIPLLQKFLLSNVNHAHAWYLLGQCYRFTNQIDDSVQCLNRATSIDKTVPSYFLALGISNQLIGRFEDSLSALITASKIDPNYPEAFISAALTLKRMGNLEKSVEIFDEAANALARQYLIGTPNNMNTRIFGYRDVVGNLWTKFALNAVLQDIAFCSVDGISLPTNETARYEYQNKTNKGLFWEDINTNNKSTRMIFPNFFDGVREFFILDARYCNIIGDKGLVLEALNKNDEAKTHFNEAKEFQYLNKN